MCVSSGWLAGAVRQALVDRLEQSLGRPVAVGSVGGNPWYGFDLHDLVIAEPGGFSRGVVFSADRIHIVIDIASLALHPGNVTRSIVRVDLVTPRIAVARDASGAWNLAGLLSRAQTPLGLQFRGRITVQGGIVGFTDGWESAAAPFATRFSGIAGTIAFRPGRQVAFDLAGRSADAVQAAVHGEYLVADGIYDLDVSWKGGDAKRWGAYFVNLRQLRWDGGRFDGQAHVLVTPDEGETALDYSATVQLRDGTVEYLPGRLDLRRVSGTIVVGDGRAGTPSLSAVVNGAPVEVRGSVAYPERAAAWLDLVVTSPRVDLGTVRRLFFPGASIGLAGQASGDVWITGPFDAPYLDGTVDAAAGRLNAGAFSELRTRFQYGAGLFALSDLSARVAGGQVAGSGVVGVSGTSGSYAFVATADNVDLRALAETGVSVPAGVSGRVSGDLAGVGTGARAHLLGAVTMPAGAARGMSFTDLHALFWDDQGALALDFVGARRGGAVAYGYGGLTPAGAIDLAVSAYDVPLDQIPGWFGMPQAQDPILTVSGEADLEGRLTGTVRAPVVSGEVTAWDGRLGLVPFDLAKGEIEAGPQRIGSTGLALVRGAASYDVRGQLGLHPLFIDGVSIEAVDVPAAPFARVLVPGVDLLGTLSGRIAVAGPLEHPAVSGTIALADGAVAGQRFDAASVEFAGTAGRVRVESFSATVNDSRLDASGLVDLGGPVDLDITADRIHLSDIPSLGRWGLALAGTVSLAGQVTGTTHDPELKATIESPEISINGQGFQASGAIDYRDGTLTVAPVSLVQRDQRYGVTGVIKMGAQPTADLNFSVQHGQIATIVAAASEAPPVPIAGTIDGSVTLEGPFADPTAHLVLSMQDGRVDGIPVGTGNADLTLTHGTVDIQTLELHPQRGTITVLGRVELAGTSAVEVSGQDLDVNLLRPVFRMGPQDALTGTLSFTVQWGGPTRDPTVGLALEATDAGLPNATVDRVAVLAYYKDGIVTVEDGTIDKGAHELALEGTLPVDPRALALTPNGPLDLRLSLADTDLSFLTLFTPAIRNASGTIAGQVTVGGTPANPVMTGSLESRGGRFTVGPMTTPVENLNVDITFSQSELVVRALSATIGGGPLTAQGTISVKDLRPDTVALSLTGRDLTMAVAGLYTGGVDGLLTLSGPAATPTLAGAVTLSHGTVTLTSALAPGSLVAVPLRLDVPVELGDDVMYVQGPARARLAGTLHVGGTIGEPALSGQIQAVNGTIAILGTPYTISRGVLTFGEQAGLYPQISASAQGTYGATRVFLDIDGVLPTPTLTWSSDPPLSQDQVLALVAGTSSTGSSPAGFLSQMLFGSISSSIQQAFRLDALTVSYNPQNPFELQIGKYLLTDVYLSLGEVFGRSAAYTLPAFGSVAPFNASGQPYTVLGIQYHLSPTVSASYNVDSLGDNVVYLLARIPF